MENRNVYHYTVRYTFTDKKKLESGHGIIDYVSMTKIEDAAFDIISWLEKEIAFERKHEQVTITCYTMYKTEYLS